MKMRDLIAAITEDQLDLDVYYPDDADNPLPIDTPRVVTMLDIQTVSILYKKRYKTIEKEYAETYLCSNDWEIVKEYNILLLT